MATQVLGRVRRTLGGELPLRMMVEAPRLGALALQIERARVEPGAETSPITRVHTSVRSLWSNHFARSDGAA